jgi:hypothetical protein
MLCNISAISLQELSEICNQYLCNIRNTNCLKYVAIFLSQLCNISARTV